MKRKKEIIVLLILALGVASTVQYRSLEKTIHALPWWQVVETEFEEGEVDQQNVKQNQQNEEQQKTQEEQNKEDLSIPKTTIREEPNLNLYALSACLMDASNGRVLYEKDGYREMAMASTTKIMTLLVVLENANLEDVVTISSNAAKQPDVQLNARTGEKYILRDLLFSLMLESHNDVAVAVAEHVGGSVDAFCEMMTAKAKELGANHTQFKTPNGLDADGHYTTAADLALISSYAIKNEEFCKIIKQQTYEFREQTKGRSFTVNNKDRFLYMMKGAIGIKTGFTNQAGYCFVGALCDDGKTYISVVLGSGWPPHKLYKWSDTQALMHYGLDHFNFMNLANKLYESQPDFTVPSKIVVKEGQDRVVGVYLDEPILNDSILMADDEVVNAVVDVKESLRAPVKQGDLVGCIKYYINGKLYKKMPMYTANSVKKIDFSFILKELLKVW